MFLRFLPIFFFFLISQLHYVYALCQSGSYFVGGFSAYTDDSQTTSTCANPNPIACYSNSTGSCVSSLFSGSYYYLGGNSSFSSCNYNGCVTTSCGSRTCNTLYYNCIYTTRCNTQVEADSVSCELGGGKWNGSKCFQCGEMTCKTVTNNNTIKGDNSSVTCIGSSCFGGGNCRVFSQLQRVCSNDCGDSTISTIATDTIYYNDPECDAERYFEDCSAETFCYDLGKNYILYKKCLTGQVFNGIETTQTKLIASGLGSCSSQGYASRDPSNNGGGADSSGTTPPDTVGNDCLVYGVGCPFSSSSEIDYSDEENRTSQNGCKCKSYDGLDFMSVIVCPDGSSSTFYGSCNDWNKLSSSSSSSVSSSSSGEDIPPGGSSDSPGVGGDYPTYSQMREHLILMGGQQRKLDDLKTSLNNINNNIQGINSGLANASVNGVKDTVTSDNDLDTVIVNDKLDSATFIGEFKAFMDSLEFANEIIDTVQVPQVVGCLEFTLIPENFSLGKGQKIEKKVVDLGNLSGHNLCNISRELLKLLAQISSFIIIVGVFAKFGSIGVGGK